MPMRRPQISRHAWLERYLQETKLKQAETDKAKQLAEAATSAGIIRNQYDQQLPKAYKVVQGKVKESQKHLDLLNKHRGPAHPETLKHIKQHAELTNRATQLYNAKFKVDGDPHADIEKLGNDPYPEAKHFKEATESAADKAAKIARLQLKSGGDQMKKDSLKNKVSRKYSINPDVNKRIRAGAIKNKLDYRRANKGLPNFERIEKLFGVLLAETTDAHQDKYSLPVSVRQQDMLSRAIDRHHKDPARKQMADWDRVGKLGSKRAKLDRYTGNLTRGEKDKATLAGRGSVSVSQMNKNHSDAAKENKARTAHDPKLGKYQAPKSDSTDGVKHSNNSERRINPLGSDETPSTDTRAGKRKAKLAGDRLVKRLFFRKYGHTGE
jgi:hypothetical protein